MAYIYLAYSKASTLNLHELPLHSYYYTKRSACGVILTLSLSDYLSALSQPAYLPSISKIGRGIEREALRILPEGRLSEQPHAYNLGSALTHPYITTDYSETLIELITPVSQSAQETIAQLEDIQKFTYSQIDTELLWPLSMPCFVNDATKIQLAQYGSSNIGRMKTVYRQGLKNRYGSMMQVISGIHFNFSFSEEFWQAVQNISGDKTPLNDFISARYFALIRNYKRYCWLIPYLYGSSPIICSSFLQGKPQKLPFKKSGNGYLYLEHATSLRMSGLGYTNSAQSSLHICYNDLEIYVAGVRNAIGLGSEKFSQIGVKVDGEYRQLNDNILQIENELYAPIRPKRVAKSGEKPSEALSKRGVEYIEVRALDVNPFVETGISLEQVNFLDIFLTFCALSPSDDLNENRQIAYEQNMNEVVIRGRDPQLLLIDGEQQKTIKHWGNELFKEFSSVANLLDQAYGSHYYVKAAEAEHRKIDNSALTPSAQILELTIGQGNRLTGLALDYAQAYRDNLLSKEYQYFSESELRASVKTSHAKQKEIEDNDTLSFDDFLTEYFKK